MKSVMKALVIAEELAASKGNINQFIHQYTVLREYNNIASSIQGALGEQGLWDEFVKACGVDLIQRYWPV